MHGNGKKSRGSRFRHEGSGMTGLERFIEAKQAEIEALERIGEENIPLWPHDRSSFRQAISAGKGGRIAVIAEYKRASPSRGVICESLSPEEVMRQYAAGGAAAVSVLTEEAYFHGSMHYIERMALAMNEAGRHIPLLRKDFIFHPLQVAATLASPASALLLIVRLTPDIRLLRQLREQAEEGGLDAVVEVFDEQDLALARESGARIIQVNARNLVTLKVDRNACLKLIRAFPPEKGELWVAASGMSCHRDVQDASECGFHAVLIGSSLMENARPRDALRTIMHGEEKSHAD